MASMTEFGAKIDRVLKEKGLRDSDLAKKMDVKPPQIFALKHKTKNPREETVRAVAKALGKTVDYFVGASKSDTQSKKVAPTGGWAPIKRAAPKAGSESKRTGVDEHASRSPEDVYEKPNQPKGADAIEEQLNLSALESFDFDRAANTKPIQNLESSAVEKVPTIAASTQATSTDEGIVPDAMELKVYVTFELNGKIVSKKQIKRLPADFEF